MEPENEEVDDEMIAFTQDIAAVINRHSMEGESDTPDFILAEFMVDCMCSFNEALKSDLQETETITNLISSVCCAYRDSKYKRNEWWLPGGMRNHTF